MPADTEGNLYALFRSRFPADRSKPCFLLPDGQAISYGAVEGWKLRGNMVNPNTAMAGAFQRHPGGGPSALPKSGLAARGTGWP